MKLPAWLHIHPSRLASAPAAHILATESDITRVRIDGLVCGVCAARTTAALERLPGVRSAHVDLQSGTALIERKKDLPDRRTLNQTDLDAALRTVVLGMWARRLLERAIHLLTRPSRLAGETPAKRTTREGRA